jgi:hypothetical protein
MEPDRGYQPAGSANEPHEIAALGLLEDEVADNGSGLFETAEEPSDASADRSTSTASATPCDQADDASPPSLGLGSQEPLSVGDSLSYALAVEIECCIG